MRQSVVITVLILSGYKLQDDLLLQQFITHNKGTNNLCKNNNWYSSIHQINQRGKERERGTERGGQRERLAHTLPRDTAWLCPQRRTTRTVSLLRPRNHLMWICPGSQPVSIKDPEGTRGTLSAEGTSMNVGRTDNTSAVVFPWKGGEQLNMNEGAGWEQKVTESLRTLAYLWCWWMSPVIQVKENIYEIMNVHPAQSLLRQIFL